MKTAPRFKNSWFVFAMIVTVAAFEALAWIMSSTFGYRLNPLTVGFLGVGVVAIVTSILYDGVDIG